MTMEKACVFCGDKVDRFAVEEAEMCEACLIGDDLI